MILSRAQRPRLDISSLQVSGAGPGISNYLDALSWALIYPRCRPFAWGPFLTGQDMPWSSFFCTCNSLESG